MVKETMDFFMSVDDEHTRDGEQTARDVIAHLVFWHRQYTRAAAALAVHRTPRPFSGKFRDWNARAAEMFACEPLPEFAQRLVRSQHQLHDALERVPNWRVNFTLKVGSAGCSVSGWVPRIHSHLAGHLTRLRRAERLQKLEG